MNHARTSGASIYELTKVTGISFSSTDPSQPSSVTWSHKTPQPISFDGKLVSSSSTSVGTTTFTYLIDATGRAGILSTKYLKNRYFNASLKNLAVWGYWKNVGVYGVGTPRQGAPWFEALTVIQGASDMGTQLFETELQKSIDFCVDIFNPTTTEQHERLSRSPGIESELLDVNSPIVDPKFLDIALHVARRNANLKTSPNGDSDEGKSPSDAERAMEDKRFLNKVNARKVVHAEYAGNSNMESEPLEGFVMRLERGQLGLSIFKPDS
ncbi:hypothetical protein H0H81_012610 [Sphagnurus paluster]|uniref:Uncharacterized protein n=1 Tax=Sphagnurus paluster TaxID=117069 RepID=A0A9P7K227_9AGAR|nr:hypothetical protein H0H81_012610 [Sphagnurus paluster]